MRKRSTIKSPSLVQKSKNLKETVLKWKSAGYPIADSYEYNRRMNHCKKCPFFKNLPIGGQCLKCGCYSIKLWILTSKCPINKW